MDISIFTKGKGETLIPKNENELISIIKKNKGSPICVGGGTSVYGLLLKETPSDYYISLQNINFSKENFTFGAGITLEKMENFLNKSGYSFPVKIMSLKYASLGGSFASSASGYGSYKYGFINDNIKNYTVLDKNGKEINFRNNKRISLIDIKNKKTDSKYGVIKDMQIKPILLKEKYSTCYIFEKDKMLNILKERDSALTTLMLFGKKTLEFTGINKRFILIESEEKQNYNLKKLDFFSNEMIIRGKFGIPKELPKRVEIGVIMDNYEQLFKILEKLDMEENTNYVVNFHKEFAILNVLFTKKNILRNEGQNWIDRKKKLFSEYFTYPYRFGKIFS
jgi:uncharacterized protein YrzB (UPF0473 family)